MISGCCYTSETSCCTTSIPKGTLSQQRGILRERAGNRRYAITSISLCLCPVTCPIYSIFTCCVVPYYKSRDSYDYEACLCFPPYDDKCGLFFASVLSPCQLCYSYDTSGDRNSDDMLGKFLLPPERQIMKHAKSEESALKRQAAEKLRKEEMRKQEVQRQEAEKAQKAAARIKEEQARAIAQEAERIRQVEAEHRLEIDRRRREEAARRERLQRENPTLAALERIEEELKLNNALKVALLAQQHQGAG